MQKEGRKKFPKEVLRREYSPTDYLIEKTHLNFDIRDGQTKVEATLTCRLRDEARVGASLRLHGEDLKLQDVWLGEVCLNKESGAFSIDTEENLLCIDGSLLPKVSSQSFVVKTCVSIIPEKNFQLSGLYKSGDMYCTQCEAEGFRRITYFLDRPDVMSRFTVRVEAPEECSVLLSNGNLTGQGKASEDGRRFAEFKDPYPKPCYLFALVAGNLSSINGSFTTASGREVALGIYSEGHNVDQLDWSLESLKKAMKWDEVRYGREYDLDVFNIVAVDDFNMGAMENKGLNVFNTALLLAKPTSTTDADYFRILGVVGHEYFHNWTGNRITCRDWFQLTLKEGLTVYRDQEFSRDETSKAVIRIEDVIALRGCQYSEDSGPMAHAIRPESYIVMDNFYTATVYNKGAEVVRMYATLLGEDGFRKGMNLYFKRHDGQAVTCDDFRAAMADANGADLAQFERWYLQAGTPTLTVESTKFDKDNKTYTVTFSQKTDPTPGQVEKLPLHIPIRTGLLSRTTGREITPSRILELTSQSGTFVFDNIQEEPVPSILRDFSAPVRLLMERSSEDLAFLMANDTDDFNKWEAGQMLCSRVVLASYHKLQQGANIDQDQIPEILAVAWQKVLNSTDMDRAVQAYSLRIPDERTLKEEVGINYDPGHLHMARMALRRGLAQRFEMDIKTLYDKLSTQVDAQGANAFTLDPKDVATRMLRCAALLYLSTLKTHEVIQLALTHFRNAFCATDKIAALQALADIPGVARDDVLASYYDESKESNLKQCKWFGVQSTCDIEDCLDRVKALMAHSAFNLTNPNKVRSVVAGFASNLVHFHKVDGTGYQFVGDVIKKLDPMNPQLASRLCTFLAGWKKIETGRGSLMKKQLLELKETPDLSKDVLEIVVKALR